MRCSIKRLELKNLVNTGEIVSYYRQKRFTTVISFAATPEQHDFIVSVAEKNVGSIFVRPQSRILDEYIKMTEKNENAGE